MWAEESVLLRLRGKAWEETVLWTQFAVSGAAVIISIMVIVAGFSLLSLARNRGQVADTQTQIGNTHRAKAEGLMNIVLVQREIAGHSLDLGVAMQSMAEHTARLTHADGSIVESLDGEDMVYRAASGTAAPHIGMRLKAAGSLSGMCVRDGAVLRCDDSETDERVDRTACRRIGLRSMIVVPLWHREQRLGVLKVISSRPRAFDEDDVATLELLAGVLSGVLSDAIAAETLLKLNDELIDANSNLERLATTDGMTGLKNHRVFQETLVQEYQRARRYDKPLSLMMLDVDFFKKYNDSFGHPAGDVRNTTTVLDIRPAMRC
jgi:predicted signal transduction protein with EAL and GGDEF domain